MDNTGRMAPAAVGLALLLGILGNLLIIHSDGMGLGPALWVAALVAGTMGLARWTLGRDGLQGEGRWLLIGAVIFAAGLVWRASVFLHFLDILAIGLCLGLAALTLRGGSLSRAGVLSYPLGLALSAVLHAIGPFLLLFNDVQWRELPRSGWSRHAGAVLRGLLIAVPLLVVFGGLFAAADAVFAELVGRVFTFDGEALFEHIFGTAFFGALAAGFLRTGLIRDPEELPRMGSRGGISLGAVETGVVLGLLNLLFLAFVLVQVRYLFGGAELVLASAHLTYAEYARSGFFELVQVTVLVLPVLLALHWALPVENEAAHRLYRWLGVPLVGLLFVIMASAMQRMRLYVVEYGLTELRLYTTAFKLWMALLFIWFLATVMRGQRDRFAVGALTGGMAVLLVLHAVNPGALIARTNVALAQRTGRFDAAYAASLGPDAVPVLVEALETLPDTAREELARELKLRYDRPSADWRNWNWGSARAERWLSSVRGD